MGSSSRKINAGRALASTVLAGLLVAGTPAAAEGTPGPVPGPEAGPYAADPDPVVETTPAPPTESTAFADARRSLPSRFRSSETKRFVVLSDADSRWTLDQAHRLERTHHQFQRFAKRLGFRPRPLEHKLVCVLFDDRDDYLSFAARCDDVTDPWIAGYYSPRHDRIVFYRGESNPSVEEARTKLAQMRKDAAELERRAARARREGRLELAATLTDQWRQYRRHFNNESSRIDDFAKQVSTATIVHESLHQLMFHSGLQSRHLSYPVWISEGLATAFETDVTNVAFGPDHEYEPRRTAFDEIVEDGRLIDLRRLVTWSTIPNDNDVVHVVYHESYALVTWMSRFRRKQMLEYLALLIEENTHEISPARALALFEQVFGDVDALERAWLRHERG